ncbi:flagellar filament capping protein FliD [Glaciimonas sp. GNP009]
MTGIVTDGIGSGLQLGPLLDQLKAAEQIPLQALQAQSVSYTSKLSAYGTLSSLLNNFQTASSALAASALYQTVKATSGSASVLTAVAGANGAAGSYAINVSQLAQAQTLAAVGQASAKTSIGNGTVTIQFGKVSGGTLDPSTGKYSNATFAADASRAAGSVTIDSSSNTLEGIRDAINKSTTLGVTATIVNDGGTNPNRLVLTSNTTGETSSMQISVTGDAALENLLSQNVGGGNQNMQETVSAMNAKLTVNGIAITSASNTVTDAIPDVSMTLVSAANTTLTVARDTTAVSTAVTAFVTAYNNLQKAATTLTAYDGTSKTGAVLSGDSVLRSIQSGIRSLLTTPQNVTGGSTGGFASLSQIGVSLQTDGTLSIDSVKLSKALNTNLDSVGELFSGTTGNSGTGLGTQLTTLLKGFNATDGMLTAATSGVNKTLDDLSKQYKVMSAQIDDTMARYKSQFTALDLIVTQLNATSTYLTQQFDAINNTK